ncbi:MAG: 3-carboxy-cis,cis-muconate cycloisomerase [Candidatus Binatia bacterium]
MATALESAIFRPLFSDDEVAELFADKAYLRAMVDVETALARAEARLGVIPSWAGEQIAAGARSEKIDLAEITRGTASDGFPVIALVSALRAMVGPQAAAYVHWGATTQDIMDTASVLQLRAAIAIFTGRVEKIVRDLAALADQHRATVLAGRTHGQQALPISFGLKAAMWLAPMVRHRQRLDAISPNILVVQFGGASGTLAALGDKGIVVMEELAGELGLGIPIMPWHTQRDGFVEFAGWLSLATGSLAKMAQDIILLAQTEVGEAAEASERGRGGSSTMPQKSNPITSELIIAAARTNASLLSAMHQALIQEHERATHGWQVEWLALPQMILLTGAALKHALYLTENLQVNAAKMRENLTRANDIVLAEAVVFALSGHMPRTQAHETVKQACRLAASEGKCLVDVVRDLIGNTIPDGSIDWKRLADPANYLGETQRMIDRVLQRAALLFPTARARPSRVEG